MEYFTQQELAELKTLVIKLHMQQRKNNTNSQEMHRKEHTDDNTILLDKSQDLIQPSLHQLPDEILLKIFSNMSFGEKFKAAKVCKRWNSLIYDKSNWIKLSFSDWKTSNFYLI